MAALLQNVGVPSVVGAMGVSLIQGAECHYVVVKNSHSPGLLGLWSGPKGPTWRKVEETLRGGRLAGSGAKLKKVANPQEAKDYWNLHMGDYVMEQWMVQ